MKSSPFRKQAQAGFTLIELIVVIVILGILAATALPRMFDMSGQARLAKMQAALGAVRAASASAHAQWLVNGGQLACTACSPAGTAQLGTAVTGESLPIKMVAGYPDVGGDQTTNTSVLTAGSGILDASGLSAQDYVLTTFAPGTTATPTVMNLSVAADASHPSCIFTYTEGVQAGGAVTNVQPTVTSAPAFSTALLTLANCS